MKEGNAKMKSNRKYPPQQTGWVTAEAIIIIIIIKSVLTHSDNTGNGNYAQKIQENCSHRETGKSFKNHTKNKAKKRRDDRGEGSKVGGKIQKQSGFAKIFGIRNMRQNDNKCGEEKKGGNE